VPEGGAAGKDLPTKFLPPGRVQELFELYQQMSPGSCASLSTFTRCFRDRWRRAIVFRDKGTRSRCTLCSRLSKLRALAKSDEARAEVRKSQAEHVSDVMADRRELAYVWRLCEDGPSNGNFGAWHVFRVGRSPQGFFIKEVLPMTRVLRGKESMEKNVNARSPLFLFQGIREAA